MEGNKKLYNKRYMVRVCASMGEHRVKKVKVKVNIKKSE